MCEVTIYYGDVNFIEFKVPYAVARAVETLLKRNALGEKDARDEKIGQNENSN